MTEGLTFREAVEEWARNKDGNMVCTPKNVVLWEAEAFCPLEEFFLDQGCVWPLVPNRQYNFWRPRAAVRVGLINIRVHLTAGSAEGASYSRLGDYEVIPNPPWVRHLIYQADTLKEGTASEGWLTITGDMILEWLKQYDENVRRQASEGMRT